jgi:iron-sulfur cluster repair protein YtfE (RIC family)
MKRHPALEELSHDHHQALVVAQRLKRADDASAEQARAGFLDYWEREGSEHFREEEEILLPALARFTDPHQPLIGRVLTDHVSIRCRACGLRGDASLAALHALGEELDGHVRREERELFPLIERVMPEPELMELASKLES